MSDRFAGKYKQFYKQEFFWAQEVLGSDGLKWSKNDYEAFTYKDDLVHLIFYPHKTSAGNHHIRVRNQNSKDRTRAEDLMRALDCHHPVRYSCTFSRKLGG